MFFEAVTESKWRLRLHLRQLTLHIVHLWLFKQLDISFALLFAKAFKPEIWPFDGVFLIGRVLAVPTALRKRSAAVFYIYYTL